MTHKCHMAYQPWLTIINHDQPFDSPFWNIEHCYHQIIWYPSFPKRFDDWSFVLSIVGYSSLEDKDLHHLPWLIVLFATVDHHLTRVLFIMIIAWCKWFPSWARATFLGFQTGNGNRWPGSADATAEHGPQYQSGQVGTGPPLDQPRLWVVVAQALAMPAMATNQSPSNNQTLWEVDQLILALHQLYRNDHFSQGRYNNGRMALHDGYWLRIVVDQQ